MKLTSESEMVHVNGKKVGGNEAVTKFTAYVSPFFVVSNGGAYTKHIYAGDQRIASKLGNENGFGVDPRRVEQAGGKKYDDNLAGTIKARYDSLGISYSSPKIEDKVEKDSTVDSEEEETLVFFYHPDHLGSTSYVTDADGNIAQHIEYIPYGEVFVEERNSKFSTNFLFNAKELDNETGLYYYGARYLDPTGAMWLSVDPLFEKYAGMSPYNYCAGNPIVRIEVDGKDWILATGSRVYWYAGEYGDMSKLLHQYKSTSGFKGTVQSDVLGETKMNLQNESYQWVPGGGPTVAGEYELKLGTELEKKAKVKNHDLERANVGIESLKDLPGLTKEENESLLSAWGEHRVRMHPVNVKHPQSKYGVDKRDLESFYFHDSKKGYTSGCHEVESRFFDDLKKYIKSGNTTIKVMVSYTKDQSTYGGTDK